VKKAPRRPRAVERIRYRGKRPAGWLLAHNHVSHDVDTRHGEGGFRQFWVAPSERWRLCQCGWRPDLGPHYAITPQIESAEEAE
jgi:hypothetical protein